MGDLRLTPTLAVEAESSFVRLRDKRLVTDWFAVEFFMFEVIWLCATVLVVVTEDIGPRLRDSIF